MSTGTPPTITIIALSLEISAPRVMGALESPPAVTITLSTP